MANKDTERKKSSRSTRSSRSHYGMYTLVGLIFLSMSVYTLVSEISYLFTWANDQSIIQDNSFVATLLEMDNTSASNDGGLVGLSWARLLITDLFGVGAFIFPLFFGGVALFCFKKGSVNLVKLIFISLFGSIIISLSASFILTNTGVDDWFGTGAGGSYGHYAVEVLTKLTGTVGAALILSFLFLLWMAFITPWTLRFIDAIVDSIASFLTFKKREKKPDVVRSDAVAVGTSAALCESGHMGNGGESLSNDFPMQQDAGGNDADAGLSEYDQIMSGIDTSGDVGMGEGISEVGNGIADDLPLGDSQDSYGTDSSQSVETDVDSGNDSAAESDDFPASEPDSLNGLTEEQINALFDPRLDLVGYQAPSLGLLNTYLDKQYQVSKEELERNKLQIVKTLKNFKLGVSRISAKIGPTVTLYEIVPAPGVRVSQIKRLETDIQLSLAARGVRVVALPGKDTVGIEVANVKPSVVSMLSCLESSAFRDNNYALPVAIGKTISGEVYTFDLAKLPHLLVAGATGQGKSVGLNAILTSLLYSKHPSELKIVLVDPKKVEFSLYSKLEKHFLAQLPDADEPVITDTKKVVNTLNSLCIEMDSRYDLLKMAGVRNLNEYNEKFLNRHLNPLKGHRFMPYIVVVIDEFADLLMTAGREVEEPLSRLAQLARAIGIHLVIATQRPTTSVITGNIKANFPARIAFMVKSGIDSKTILDEVGANQLVGRGDMLISTGAELTRVQCALIETEEVEKIVDFIGGQRGYPTPHYLPEYVGSDEEDDSNVPGAVDLSKRDHLFEDAAKLVVINQLGSTSLIQRKMNLGYNRAGRIMDQLEQAGIVGPNQGSKPREVLVMDITHLDSMLANIRDVYGG